MLRTAKEEFRGKCSEAGIRGNTKRWGRDRVPDETPNGAQRKPDSGFIAADCRLPIADCREEVKPNTYASDDARFGESLPSIDDPLFGTTAPDALFPVQAPKPARLIGGLTHEQDEWFTAWWSAYWLRKAKKAARQAFGKHIRTAVRFAEVMAATQQQAPDMLTREPQHRPHGATWLNGERWSDEDGRGGPGEANRQDAALDKVYAELEHEKGNDDFEEDN